jgi:hypothetical protein
MSGRRRSDFYIETASMFVYAAMVVWLIDFYPEPLGYVALVFHAAVWWFAVGEYLDTWQVGTPGSGISIGGSK